MLIECVILSVRGREGHTLPERFLVGAMSCSDLPISPTGSTPVFVVRTKARRVL